MTKGLKDLDSKRDERFVAKSKSLRSGWDDYLRKDKDRLEKRGYSDFFFKGAKFRGQSDLILKGFDMASAFVKSMNLPFRPLLGVNRNGSFTTGKVIALHTKVFDSPLPDGRKLDVFIGLAIHECLHCERTDFPLMKRFLNNIPDEVLNKLTHQFANVIEDERIELADVQENPGHGNFLAATKDYYYNVDVKFKPGKNILQQLIDFFGMLIRYPDRIVPEMYEEFEKEYEKAKEILNPFPETYQEVLNAAYWFAVFIKDLHKKLIEEKVRKKYLIVDPSEEDEDEESGEKEEGEKREPEEDEIIPISKGKKGKESKKDSESISEDEIINPEKLHEEENSASETDEETGENPGDNPEEEEVDEENSEESNPIDDERTLSEDEKESEDGVDKEQDDSEGKESGKVSKDADKKGSDDTDVDKSSGTEGKTRAEEKIEKEIEREISGEERSASLENKEIESTVDENTEVEKAYGISRGLEDKISEVYSKSIITGTDNDTRFLLGEGNKRIYEEERKMVSNFSSAISRMLQFNHRDTKICLKGMRFGRLDTNKLAEAVQGVPNIYETFGQIKSQKGAVILLIDESGSMRWDRKIENARKAAIVFEEAIKKLSDIDLYIYGHTADGDYPTTIHIFREKGKIIPYGIGGCEAYLNNRDGVAILETAKRVRKLTDRPCVMFVISDGAPNASNYDFGVSVEDTRLKIIETEKLGMVVIGIAIKGAEEEYIKRMYKRHVFIEETSNLPFELGKIMKNVVLDLFKVRTTY